MKKRVISIALSAVLIASTAAVPAITASAVNNNTGKIVIQVEVPAEVETDLKDVASYVMKNLEDTIFAADYQISYSDYQSAMFALKAGASSDKVVEKLDAVLKEKLAAYDDTFLNPYASTGVKSYALATAILYLQEKGEDVTAYEGVNLLDKLQEAFMQEVEPNPYVYQFIAAITASTDKNWDEVKAKMKTEIMTYYVNNETGVGIDYWGVSADNNGQVLTALVNEYSSDADVKEKVDAALEWNKKQADASGAIISWGAANSSSTANALRAAAEFGAMEDAQTYYQALAQFKSTANKGAYTYSGEDSIFSTKDALTALLAYRNNLQGKSLFAVTEKSGQVAPETSTQPEQSAAPETSKAPEVSIQPEESVAPEVSTQPEESVAPETSKAPEQTTQPETSKNPVTETTQGAIADEGLSSEAPMSGGVDKTTTSQAPTTGTDKKVTAPKTGDSNMAGVLCALSAVAGGAVVLLRSKKGYHAED